MSQPLSYHIFAQLAAAVLCLSIANAQSSVVSINVNQDASVEGKHLITIADIADVTGGIPAIRRRISALDLDALDSQRHRTDQSTFEISKRQLELRLILAGIERHQFSVNSPDHVRFTPHKQLSVKSEVESMLGLEIARQFGLSADDVTAQLTNTSQIHTLNQRLHSGSFRIRAVTQNQLPVGNTKLQLEFIEDGGGRLVSTVDTRIVVSMEVALATHVIERGTVIQPEMFRMIKRPVTDRNDYASSQQLIGRVATRRIPRNEVMMANHLSNQLRSNQWDVKTNDLLDVIMLVNGSQIRLTNAKALSSANRGDTVTVLNTRSNKRLSAKVIDKNLAEIRLHGNQTLSSRANRGLQR